MLADWLDGRRLEWKPCNNAICNGNVNAAAPLLSSQPGSASSCACNTRCCLLQERPAWVLCCVKCYVFTVAMNHTNFKNRKCNILKRIFDKKSIRDISYNWPLEQFWREIDSECIVFLSGSNISARCVCVCVCTKSSQSSIYEAKEHRNSGRRWGRLAARAEGSERITTRPSVSLTYWICKKNARRKKSKKRGRSLMAGAYIHAELEREECSCNWLSKASQYINYLANRGFPHQADCSTLDVSFETIELTYFSHVGVDRWNNELSTIMIHYGVWRSMMVDQNILSSGYVGFKQYH